MYGWFNLKNKIKKYFRFSTDEIKGIIIAILIIGFIISFKEWGYEEFDWAIGLRNLLSSILIAAACIIVCQTAHKIAALKAGFTAEFKMWLYGLIIGLVLILVSRGNLWFIAPGGIVIYHMAAHRLGYFRYGTNMWALGMISLAGPLAVIVFGGFFKTLILYFPWVPLNVFLVDKLFKFSLIYAFYNLLPIPPLVGANLFFATRNWYVFIMGTVVAYIIMLLVFNFYSYILALIIGGVIWLLYYATFEKGYWSFP